jgi:hypothetical protein
VPWISWIIAYIFPVGISTHHPYIHKIVNAGTICRCYVCQWNYFVGLSCTGRTWLELKMPKILKSWGSIARYCQMWGPTILSSAFWGSQINPSNRCLFRIFCQWYSYWWESRYVTGIKILLVPLFCDKEPFCQVAVSIYCKIPRFIKIICGFPVNLVLGTSYRVFCCQKCQIDTGTTANRNLTNI